MCVGVNFAAATLKQRTPGAREAEESCSEKKGSKVGGKEVERRRTQEERLSSREETRERKTEGI